MAHPKLIIEARVNEYATRELNPHVPFTPEEIADDVAECVRQGATLVHYHPRDPITGAPSNDLEVCEEIERQIRKRCDVITQPTLGAHIVQSAGRVSHIVEWAKDPLTRPDCVPIDVITTNMAMFDTRTGDFFHQASTYENTVETMKAMCTDLKAAGVKPVAMIWNIASIRVIEVLKRLGYFEDPLYCEVVLFGDLTLGFGHPPTVKGLYSLLDFLPRDDTWHWLAHCGGGNTFGIAAASIEAGGHATIGLGDYHYPELGQPTNGDLIAQVASMARAMGREIATVAEARDTLGMHRGAG